MKSVGCPRTLIISIKRQIVTVGALTLLFLPASAQQERTQKQSPQNDEPVKLHTTLVQVPVVVRLRGGRYISDLTREEFTVYEDGVKQDISYFGSVEEPFSVALLLDSSGSTGAALDQIKSAALAFLSNLRVNDRAMVVSFNDSVEILCELTSDQARLAAAVQSIKSGEYTQVYEAVYTAVWEKLRDVPGRKAAIVFTDGIDTASSEIVEEDTLDAVIETEDVIVYPIRYATREDVERKLEARLRASRVASEADIEGKLAEERRGLDRTYRAADEYLERLAEMSGGIVERADRLGDLKSALGRIAEELRHQYLIGYYPSNKEKDDRTRKITVRVSRPSAVVRARPAYRNSQ